MCHLPPPRTLFLPISLLLIGKGTPALAQLLANLAKLHIGVLIDDLGTSILAEEHVTRKLLLAL